MNERADAVLPVLWTDAAGGSRASGSGSELLAGVPPADLVAAVCLLCLRYTGAAPASVAVRLDPSAGWERIGLDLDGADASVGSGRAAVRDAWDRWLAGAWPEGFEVTAPDQAPGGPAFGFSRTPSGGWRLSLTAPDQPADPGALTRIRAHLAAFVRADDETPVAAVPYLTSAELQLVAQVNATSRVWPPQRLDELIEAAAARRPDHPAVICGERALSHGDLQQKANALAARLVAAGAGPGRRVGILATCTPEFVVTVIATWKAGAAYVPIDPLLPSERRQALYRIGRVDLLAAEPTYLEIASELADSWVEIQPAGQLPGADSGPVPAEARAGAGLAYVIFTSGSTGEPKAAMLNHAGRVNMTIDLNERFGVTPQDRMLVVASPSFDMTIYDIFGLLAAGATAVLPSRGQEKDVAHWADLTVRHQVTMWHSVPSAVTLLLNLWADRGAGALRLFLLDGDWIPVDQPARLRERFPAARVFSLGGATEVSMVSVGHEIAEPDPDWRSVPYGRPLANQTAYVVDQFGQLAAIDLPGELWLGGAGVGWGYDRQPALTADRFVPDPFGAEPGARLYRTGDLARLRPGGWIELLGRVDQQVKVGGVRIEPGEIEFCLLSHAAVAQAVVVPVRDGSLVARSLGAFVTRSGEAADQTDAEICAALRQHLAQRLPAPLLPASISVLTELPLNHNGKVDRRQLAGLLRPGAGQAAGAASDEAADAASGQEAVVQVVGDIWQEVLGLSAMPLPHESFLDLGGGSLAAIQVAARLSRHLGVELRVTDLLNADTLARVAAVATAAARGPAAKAKPPLRPRNPAS